MRERSADLSIYCKAWPVRNGTRFLKTAFALDWDHQRIRCPTQQEMPFEPGGIVHFPAEVCAACPLRERCASSPRGRSVSIHPDKALLGELRQLQLTPAGRTKLRERVAVEHTLAHLGYWQGRRACYRGDRKIYLICAAVPSFIIYMFSLVWRHLLTLPDYSIGALDEIYT